jgi:PAS domain S-box-containing protein
MPKVDRLEVLMVEDSPSIASYLKGILEKEFSALVTWVADCNSARNRLGRFRYGIVVLDYRLPDGHGHELLEQITLTPDHPPVIMVTAHGDEQIAAMSLRLGASGYVVKDENITAQFIDTVNQAINEIALAGAEVELRKEKAFLEAALDAIPEIFCVIDISGRIIRWNRELNTATGYGDEEIVRLHTKDLFAERDFRYGRGGFADLLEGGRKHFGAYLVTRDHGRIPCDITGSLLLDEDSTTLGVCIIARQSGESDSP